MEKETKHTLNDAKQVIARKYGYVDWHQMKAACKGYEGDIDPRMLSNSDEAAELYASTIQTELSEMKKENASLQSEIDRLKEENKALIEALITCSKEDDKYSYIVARCTLKNYNHPH